MLIKRQLIEALAKVPDHVDEMLVGVLVRNAEGKLEMKMACLRAVAIHRESCLLLSESPEKCDELLAYATSKVG